MDGNASSSTAEPWWRHESLTRDVIPGPCPPWTNCPAPDDPPDQPLHSYPAMWDWLVSSAGQTQDQLDSLDETLASRKLPTRWTSNPWWCGTFKEAWCRQELAGVSPWIHTFTHDELRTAAGVAIRLTQRYVRGVGSSPESRFGRSSALMARACAEIAVWRLLYDSSVPLDLDDRLGMLVRHGTAVTASTALSFTEGDMPVLQLPALKDWYRRIDRVVGVAIMVGADPISRLDNAETASYHDMWAYLPTKAVIFGWDRPHNIVKARYATPERLGWAKKQSKFWCVPAPELQPPTTLSRITGEPLPLGDGRPRPYALNGDTWISAKYVEGGFNPDPAAFAEEKAMAAVLADFKSSLTPAREAYRFSLSRLQERAVKSEASAFEESLKCLRAAKKEEERRR